MKKTIAYLIISLISITSFGQGINFQEYTNWDDAMKSAQNEGKLVYVDFYTDWCGPCKIMAKQYFPTEEAGAAFNPHFYSLQLDAEKEGAPQAEKYDVHGYPSSLFINPKDQSVVFRFLGCPPTVDEFSELADIAWSEYNDSMSYAEYVEKFKLGERDEEFLEALIKKSNYNGEDNVVYADAYFEQWKDDGENPEEAFVLLQDLKLNSNTKFYAYVDANRQLLESKNENFDDVMGQNAYMTVISATESKDKLSFDKALNYFQKYQDQPEYSFYQPEMDFYAEDPQKLKEVTLKYGKIAMSTTEDDLNKEDQKNLENLKMQIEQSVKIQGLNPDSIDYYYQNTLEMKPMYKKLGHIGLANMLNGIAWTVVENYPEDASMVKTAIPWAERATEISVDYPDVYSNIADTYAHLLDLNGQTEQAIGMEEKALKAADETNNPNADSMREYLDEMKSK